MKNWTMRVGGVAAATSIAVAGAGCDNKTPPPTRNSMAQNGKTSALEQFKSNLETRLKKIGNICIGSVMITSAGNDAAFAFTIFDPNEESKAEGFTNLETAKPKTITKEKAQEVFDAVKKGIIELGYTLIEPSSEPYATTHTEKIFSNVSSSNTSVTQIDINHPAWQVKTVVESSNPDHLKSLADALLNVNILEKGHTRPLYKTAIKAASEESHRKALGEFARKYHDRIIIHNITNSNEVEREKTFGVFSNGKTTNILITLLDRELNTSNQLNEKDAKQFAEDFNKLAISREVNIRFNAVYDYKDYEFTETNGPVPPHMWHLYFTISPSHAKKDMKELTALLEEYNEYEGQKEKARGR